MLKVDFCGIDVSARQLTVALRRDGQRLAVRSFPNTPEGHRSICRYLARPDRLVQVCLESTGLYGLDIALALAKFEGIQVMVANPRAVRRFAQALGHRSKNDQIDAVLLEQFAARMPFEPWQPPQAAALQLRAITRRIRALTQASTAEKNRLHAADSSQTIPRILRRDLQNSIRHLHTSIGRLRKEALKIVAPDAQLKRQFDLMLTAPGIAATSAILILGEIATLSQDLDARQWVAHAGLDPRHETSASSVRKPAHISKAGNKYLRSALYMPALVARRWQPNLRAFALHLQARGKRPIQALVAVMRKLLVALFHMLRRNQTFDGSRLFKLNDTSPPLANTVPSAA
jgi:transposase